MPSTTPNTSHEELNTRISDLESDLQRTEKALENALSQLHKYKLAASGANDGLWDLNIETGEAFVSPPWKSMLGYEDMELGGQINTWEKLLHPEDRKWANKALQDYIDGNAKDYDIEFRMRHKDGSYRWIHSKGTVLRNDAGKAYRISGSHTDITERKFAEQALVESEVKYRNLFENSQVGMLRANIDTGRIIETNATAMDLFRAEEGDYFFLKDLAVDSQSMDKFLNELEEEGTVANMEMQIKRRDGTLLWVALSGSLHKDILECVVKDIEESKQHLLELQRINFELDSFVYHASHDLRSPLRSVLGLTTILKQDTDPNSRDQCVSLIESSVQRLDRLVVDLLTVSREGRNENNYEPVNLMVEVNHCVGSFWHMDNARDMEIRAFISQTSDFATDPSRMRIIFNNMISNAIKYRSFHREQSYLNIEVLVDKTKLIAKFEDNGLGIAEENVGKVFDMFFRATESSEGTGLGLYIVQNTIKKLGGSICVSSREDQGTTFSVIIPNALAGAQQLGEILP
ncbi:MAG: PAS domain-containing protein [Bacteroidota bacterium]